MSFFSGITSQARSERHPLSSRASSATLHMEQQLFDRTDGATDAADVSIAQGLLYKDSLNPSKRRSSFSNANSYRPLLADLDQSATKDKEYRSRRFRQNTTSNTWSSSGAESSDNDDKEERDPFIQEYNRLAKRYNVPVIVPAGFEVVITEKVTIEGNSNSWIMKKLLRRSSSTYGIKRKSEKQIRHRRSISDLSLRIRPKKDYLKDKVLDELVRLCGSSALYLPDAYAAATLHVPTCFRATAQYLVQHGPSTRGIFRLSGSQSTVNALYNHYAAHNDHRETVNGTVRCPQLPEHIKCDVHDVASAFKKFIGGLPTGLLGSTWLFDAFVAIYGILDADPETTRTKQSKVRARLIALAVASVPSRYERELICAVMGLLCMIGRAAETARREDERGRPLPTSDLMGYGPLGTIFGPLLIGEMIETHGISSPAHLGKDGQFHTGGHSPPKLSKEKQKKSKSNEDRLLLQYRGEKMRLANSVAEMLITNWREVVRHMRDLGALKSVKEHQIAVGMTRHLLRPSASESFAIRRPPDWEHETSADINHIDRNRSPTPLSRVDQSSARTLWQANSNVKHPDELSVRKQRSKPRLMSSQQLVKSMSVLTPTAEESPAGFQCEVPAWNRTSSWADDTSTRSKSNIRPMTSVQTFHTAQSRPKIKFAEQDNPAGIIKPTPSVSTDESIVTGKTATKSATASRNHQNTGEENGTGKFTMLQDKIRHSPEIPKRVSTMDMNTAIQPGMLSGDQRCNNPTTVLTEMPDTPRAQLRPSIEVPDGIVSRRLRVIAASDPGVQPPSGFRAFLPISNTRKETADPKFKRRHPAGITNSSGHAPGTQSKDPLTKVSEKEDMASLASLAEFMGSEDYSPDNLAVTGVNIVNRTTFDTMRLSENQDMKMSPATKEFNESTKPLDRGKRSLERLPAQQSVTVDFALRMIEPITPRRQATESGNGGKSVAGSVRAIAARFDSAEKCAGLTLSSKKPLPSRRLDETSFVEPMVVSDYITNSSPVRSHRSSRSERSTTKLHHASHTKRSLTSPIRPANTNNASDSYRESGLVASSSHSIPSTLSKWPKIHCIAENREANPKFARSTSPSFKLSSSLQQTGDGHTSFALPRKISSLNLLPRPNEPHVAQFINFARPPSAPLPAHLLDRSDTPFDVLSAGSPDILGSIAIDTQSISNSGQTLRGRGNSLLYSQIQRLKRQVEARTDEAEQLRQQLLARDSMNDLGTLSEELRQAKRDLKIWRDRAEVAEKRLDVLSHLHPNLISQTPEAPGRTSPTYKNAERYQRRTEDYESFTRRIKTAFQEMDGTRSLMGSPASNGTIRRGNRDEFNIYENGVQDYDKSKESTEPIELCVKNTSDQEREEKKDISKQKDFSERFTDILSGYVDHEPKGTFPPRDSEVNKLGDDDSEDNKENFPPQEVFLEGIIGAYELE